MKKLFGSEYRETIVYGLYARGDYPEPDKDNPDRMINFEHDIER